MIKICWCIFSPPAPSRGDLLKAGSGYSSQQFYPVDKGGDSSKYIIIL